MTEVGDTIYRQAAIEALISFFGLSIEEEYGSAIQEVLNGLSSAQSDQRWIPVTERLPEDFQSFYATCKSNIANRDNWVIEGYYNPWSGFNPPPLVEKGKAEIIAWMPKELPKPWKGESDE